MNRFLYASVFAFLLPLIAVAQSSWSVSPTVAPVFTRTQFVQRVLYPNSDGQLVEPVYLNGGFWSAGVMAGASVHYSWAPGWSVSMGGWFRSSTLRQNRLANDGTTTVRQRSLQLPLLLNARTSTRRLSPYLSVGTLIDVPMQARVIVNRTDEPTQRLRLDTEPGPFFHVLAGAGGYYQLNRQYALIVQPLITYNLGRFGGIRTHNPSTDLGLLTQLTYSF
ncbi:hypothetical protein GGR92_003800 [Spirosoma lacussanchae]|uniref:outer membrane beta-barrel protein n=1 Tax=Spirosoma lacussanchae TaxID=1884249 RepID=UPI0014864972|nr:outer membrane beta-barrel protein [Spirosoma lacussanchae]